MRILVTGSSGHLGEAIVRTLQSKNINHRSIDIKPSKYTSDVGSIIDRSFVRKCMKAVDTIIHTAAQHKAHIATHEYQDFIDTNLTGTLNLLEEAIQHRVKSFIYTSTTSAFGDALAGPKHNPAIWVTERIKAVPKDIYGVTKSAAEDLCELFCRNCKLSCVVLRTSRFFPEPDDRKAVRQLYEDENIKANEYLFRRVDIEDAVTAHLLAMDKAKDIGFGKYIISATSPFSKNDLFELRHDVPGVVQRCFPDFKKIYSARNWKMVSDIDRVYVNEKARRDLAWEPKYDFRYVLDCVRDGNDFRSTLAKEIGIKGYHGEAFRDGLYRVKNNPMGE